jgi:hypothetical protein
MRKRSPSCAVLCIVEELLHVCLISPKSNNPFLVREGSTERRFRQCLLFVKSLAVTFSHFKKKEIKSILYCHYDYRLDYDWIFWVVNFKTRNYFVIFYYTEGLPQVIYVDDCSNFVHSCRII